MIRKYLSNTGAENRSNLYGKAKSFKRFVELNCSDIKTYANQEMFTLNDIELILNQEIDFNCIKNINFIPTNEAKIRIAKILLAEKARIHLLISGPTSSAKTFSVLAAFQIHRHNTNSISKKLIRKNLSEDSTREDIIGSICFNEDENKFIFQPGPFTEAFEKGYWILLDELSLAPPSVLQSIESALDLGYLTVQEIGGTKKIDMHEDFFLVCTMNPNSNEYSRFNLQKEFLDRFLCLNFDNLSADEMKNILIKKCPNEFSFKINQIVENHLYYSKSNEKECKNIYTLREMDRAAILLNNTKFTVDRIIDILYRTRAGTKLKTYINILDHPFENLDSQKKSDFNYGKMALDCLTVGFNIILESDINKDILQLADAIAQKFNNEEQPLFISMTNELHVSDITEFSVPYTDDTLGRNNLKIKTIEGVIYKAMKEGRVVIINNLEQGNTRVIESMNDIFDCNYNVLHETVINSRRPIQIHQKFRIIFILHSKVPHKLSAAFLNRFIHIKVINNEYFAPYPSLSDPISIENSNLSEICKNDKIACTNQVKTTFWYTKNAIDTNTNICFCGENGYGRSLGINLCLKTQFNKSKVHTIYCNSEININSLIGNYVFEGKLEFRPGPLLQAAINGDIVFLKNIDHLSFHVFTCIDTIIKCSHNNKREFIIPGFDISDIKVSNNVHFIATIDETFKESIPHYIKKLFAIVEVPQPELNDYEEISKLYIDPLEKYVEIIKALSTCFYIFNTNGDNFDTSFTMFVRILSNIKRLATPSKPNDVAINLFALFQNANITYGINEIISTLHKHIDFDKNDVYQQLTNKYIYEENSISKGALSCAVNDKEDFFKTMSQEQLKAAFYLFSCDSPILLVGPTSFKQTIIDIVKNEVISVYYANEDTTISDLIGSITLKKNDEYSSEIYDLLHNYLILDEKYRKYRVEMSNINPRSKDAFQMINNILNNDYKSILLPYYQHLFKIINQKSQYDTIFELGFLLRELSKGKKILIKNIDQLSKPVINSLIPFLSSTIDLNTYIPGVVFKSTGSFFFTCSEQGYDKLPKNFLSKVQSVHIGNLTKEDVQNLLGNDILIDEYDRVSNQDYSDIIQVINTLKVAQVLNKCYSLQDKIIQAKNIIDQNLHFIDSNDSLFGKFNMEKVYSLDDLIKYDTKTFELTSLRTGVKILVENFDTKYLQDIVFVPCLAYLLDLCIISLKTNIPLIVESSPGQGKSTLIQRLAKALGKEAIITNLSRNRTSEEYIGQILPNENGFAYQNGDIFKYIDKEDVIYLIDEINLGNHSLLSQFLNIFKIPYNSTLAHPHTGQVFNKQFHLFATMNPATLSANRSYLPNGFSSCSIICKLPNYTDYDYAEIIYRIFGRFEAKIENFKQCLTFIVECHKNCMEKSDDVTIRDILKLSEIFDTYDELITKKDVVSNVQIIYSSQIKYWSEKFDNMTKTFMNDTSIEKLPGNLTKPEFLLKKQLIQALKMNRGIIIRGPSGSGKSYIIDQVFKEWNESRNNKMHVIQLCPNTDISEILGRLEPFYPDNEGLMKTLLNEIKLKLDDMNLNDEVRQKLNECDSLLPSKKNISDKIELIKKYPDIMKISSISFQVNEYIKQNENKMNFHYQNSPLIDAMINGDWVILDGINLCSNDILESLNSLLEESHSIRITKDFQEVVYSMYPNDNINNIEIINTDFRLIMTSDDRELSNLNIFPAPFISRCIVLHINNPTVNELPKIARNHLTSSEYANFISKCLLDIPQNQTRDIIRIIKTFNLIINNTKKREYSIGKALKFILGTNFTIPSSFILSDRDEHDDILEILALIQTNLFDEKLDDENFAPLTNDFIQQSFKKLGKIEHKDDLQSLFLTTLRLSCYVLSQDNFEKTKNQTIKDSLITFLICGFFFLTHQKIPPDFIWNLHFNPSIWNFLFIIKDNYDKILNEKDLINFIKTNISTNDELKNEIQKALKIKDINDNFDENINKIKDLFNQNSNKDIEAYTLSVEEKSKIKIESLPILFQCMRKTQLLKDEMKYSNLIEMLNYFEISSPYNKIIQYFNFNLSNYHLAQDFSNILGHKENKNIALLHENLLKFDSCYQIIKKIINDNYINKYDLNKISKIASQYDTSLDILNEDIIDMESFIKCYEDDKDQIKDVLLYKINEAKKIINKAYQNDKEKALLSQKESEILDKINNMRSEIRNPFIDEIISELIKSPLNENLLDKIQEWILFDSRIIDDYSYRFDEFNIQYSYEDEVPNQQMCDKLRNSVIITSFIVPPNCESFKIPKIFFSQPNPINFITTEEIMKYLRNINQNDLNNKDENYKYLEEILKKGKFETISLRELESIQNISQIIRYMKSYKIGICLISNNSKPNLYITHMLNKRSNIIIKKSMTHLKEEEKYQIISEYDAYLEGNANEEPITEEILKKECPSIPTQDWGYTNQLPFFENDFNQPTKQIAFYLTNYTLKNLNVEKKETQIVHFNNKEYQLIPIENLYINYIYLKNLERVEKSLFIKFEYNEFFGDIFNLDSPDKFLKKDIIIFLSQLNEKDFNDDERIFIKDASYRLWGIDYKTSYLDICNNDLHTFYCTEQRSKYIDFQNRTKFYENKVINEYNSLIHKLSFEVQFSISSIRTKFIKLLYIKKSDILNIDRKNTSRPLMTTIENLAKVFLTPVKKYSQYDGPCFVIVHEGEYFIEKYDSVKQLPVKTQKAYILELIDNEYENPNDINEFYELTKLYKEYSDLSEKIMMIQNKSNDLKNIFEIEELLCPFHNNDKFKQISIKLIEPMKQIMHAYTNLMQKFPFNEKTSIPLIIFNESKEPFHIINDILMLICIKGSIKFLNEINFDLGDCLTNSLLIINIINNTNAIIRTKLNSDVNQKNNLLMISTKITDGIDKIELFDVNSKNIGSIGLKYNLVDPEIYLLFSTPVTIKENKIEIIGDIYKQFQISIYSNVSVPSHILKLNTLKGSTLTENFVKIENKNDLIQFTFLFDGTFKANINIHFPKFDENVSIYLEINVFHGKEETNIFNAETLNQLRPKESMTESSYYIVRTPLPPLYNDKNTRFLDQEYPYLHLIYTDNNNQSFIQTFISKYDIFFTEKYFPITNREKLIPKLSLFKSHIINKNFCFRMSNQQVTLIEKNNNDFIVEFVFNQDHKLEYMTFSPKLGNPKNYSENGIILSDNLPNFLQNQLNYLKDQIRTMQSIQLDEYIIPWIAILRLFETSSDEFIKENSNKIIQHLKINNDQTYYAFVKQKEVSSIKNIPESVLKKTITQTIIESNEITNDFKKIESIDYRNVFDIIKNLDEIKLAMQCYRQIYNKNKKAALILTNIYTILEWLITNNIMVDTFGDIYSLGRNIFEVKNKSHNITLISDSDKKESTLDIKFKYPNIITNDKKDTYNLNKITRKLEKKVIENKKETIPINKLFVSNSINVNNESSNSIVKNIYQILSNKEKEINENNTFDEDTNENAPKNIDKLKTDVHGKVINNSKDDFDESKLPKKALEKSRINDDKMHQLSSIEENNDNLFLQNNSFIEDELPDFNSYIINILVQLSKSNYNFSLPEKHITLLFDISQLSGGKNKDMLAMNMMVILKMLTVLGIKFSVWMFADRNLCFCVKTPSNNLQNDRLTLIRDAYYLDRINPESDVLSAIYKVHTQKIEKNSSLFIVFSTFISAQIFYKKDNSWQNLNDYIGSIKLIGIIEPYQYTYNEVDEALKNALIESNNNVYLIKFIDICASSKELLLKIFEIFSKTNNQSKELIQKPLNIGFHKFNERQTYDNDILIFKHLINNKKPKVTNFGKNSLNAVKIDAEEDFEIINIPETKLGDLKFSISILGPNIPTRYELTSHGSVIDSQGLIKAYFSNFTNMNIFKQKTGDKKREYCVDVLVDASSIIKNYTLDHCFLSIVSLLDAFKELEIPLVNLVIAGSSIIPFLIYQNLRYLSKNDTLYSKLYSILFEKASEMRSLSEALKYMISHSVGDSIPHVMFIITDALLGQEQENEIKELLSFIQISGTTVIGIGTGPVPYRISNIFSWSIWSKNPYKLRKALLMLSQSPINKDEFKQNVICPNIMIPQEIPDFRNKVKNSESLKQFSDAKFIETALCIRLTINNQAFQLNNLNGNYLIDSQYDAYKDNSFKGYKVLVMMFYQGEKGTDDESISKDTFINGPKDNPEHIKSPGQKLEQKGFEYVIVTTYREASKELITGKYCIAMLCTASTGEDKQKEDQNYFVPFLNVIKQFHLSGGALILFGENPPFIYEINCILDVLPNIQVRMDPCFRSIDPGGGIMKPSQNKNLQPGEFLNCENKFKAKINGIEEEFMPFSGGLKRLFEGRTLAKFINLEQDKSFRIFSITQNGEPSCIFRIPKGNEGVIFADTGCSKLFLEYAKRGVSRYISNMVCSCIHYSNLRNTYTGVNTFEETGIKVNVNISPKPPISLFKRKPEIYPPLLISMIVDATGSMFLILKKCRNLLKEFLNICKLKTNEIEIFIQFVYYRDLSEEGIKMCNSSGIQSDPDRVVQFMSTVSARYGGSDGPENMSAGFEKALHDINEFQMNHKLCRNVFIVIGDAPNQDQTIPESRFPLHNERKETWETVWKNIDTQMRELQIDQLLTVSCKKEFEKQFDIWKNYQCQYILSILINRELKDTRDTETLENLFNEYFSNKISSMYTSNSPK